MNTKQYIIALFDKHKIVMPQNRVGLFDDFIKEEVNVNAVNQIIENQKMMTDKWQLKLKIQDIIDKHIMIPNANMKKPYEAKLDFAKLGIVDMADVKFEGLEEYGLEFDKDTDTIKGIPAQSGDFKVTMKFRMKGESEDSAWHSKPVSILINADPKSLWLDKESNKEDTYWKEDNASDFQKLGDGKHIVVASKRGRSHANVGSFRDDDYAFKYYEPTGWSIVCVSDGAGSAKSSRKGSQLACDAIVDYFESNLTTALSAEFDELMRLHQEETPGKEAAEQEVPKAEEKSEANAETPADIAIVENTEPAEMQKESTQPVKTNKQKIGEFIYNTLGSAARSAHKILEEFAKAKGHELKDLHSTLIFALFKKYDFGYVVLSFSVGDCPIALLNKDMSELKLMNWLDVGEFGGGTRFITMPEIFTSDKFKDRFGFKIIDDFSRLMLMTDGIYDPKFVVEANLEKLEKWKEFLADLDGNNEEKIKVDFNPVNKEIESQLSVWMDFWSPGNHDDRTLAIIF